MRNLPERIIKFKSRIEKSRSYFLDSKLFLKFFAADKISYIFQGAGLAEIFLKKQKLSVYYVRKR